MDDFHFQGRNNWGFPYACDIYFLFLINKTQWHRINLPENYSWLERHLGIKYTAVSRLIDEGYWKQCQYVLYLTTWLQYDFPA